jgi:hypothetical protein
MLQTLIVRVTLYLLKRATGGHRSLPAGRDSQWRPRQPVAFHRQALLSQASQSKCRHFVHVQSGHAIYARANPRKEVTRADGPLAVLMPKQLS